MASRTRTQPKQAASASWLDRAQRQVQACLTLLEQRKKCQTCEVVWVRLQGLLRSMARAERR